jgi:CyaY protein
MAGTTVGTDLAGRYRGPVCPQPLSRFTNANETEIATKCFKFKYRFAIKIMDYRNFSECSMTESEFVAVAETALDQIEASLEKAAEAHDLDIECSRAGNVLDIEFAENGSKIIVNSQTPMQEIWVAAKSGGFHYKLDGLRWINTRDGSELFSTLSKLVSAQSGCVLVLHPDLRNE